MSQAAISGSSVWELCPDRWKTWKASIVSDQAEEVREKERVGLSDVGSIARRQTVQTTDRWVKQEACTQLLASWCTHQCTVAAVTHTQFNANTAVSGVAIVLAPCRGPGLSVPSRLPTEAVRQWAASYRESYPSKTLLTQPTARMLSLFGIAFALRPSSELQGHRRFISKSHAKFGTPAVV